MPDSMMAELVRRIAGLEARCARLEEAEQGRGVVFLTTQLTSTSWDGDVKTSANNGTIDLSAVFGVPAGIKAVLCAMTVYSTTDQISLVLKPDSDASSAPPMNPHTIASKYAARAAWVPCDASGDVYFSSSSASNTNVWLEVWGYAV
jgi:hypothetical protein